MFRTVQLLTIAWLFLTAGCVQSEPTELTVQDIAALQATMQELYEAIVAGDAEAVVRICSDDYQLTNRRGVLRTKAERIQRLATGRLRYLNLGDREDVEIRTYGNVAVVTGIGRSTLYELDGEERQTGDRRFTAVWVLEDGAWRQVARQHTVIASDAT